MKERLIEQIDALIREQQAYSKLRGETLAERQQINRRLYICGIEIKCLSLILRAENLKSELCEQGK